MASYDTLQALSAHPEWIAPRSDRRVFLGEPGAPEATKTTVEPGNVFSPGMRTFGVTWWIRFPTNGGEFYATETAPLDSLKWHYERGYLPLLHCETQVEGLGIRHSLFQDGNAAQRSEAVCGRLELTNMRARALDVQVFIALRSLGPAGGRVGSLAVGADRRSFWTGTASAEGARRAPVPLLAVDQPPNAIGCGVGDPSSLARAGEAPPEQVAQDRDGWCYGLMRFDVTLPRGGAWQLCLDCPQQTQGSLRYDLPGTVAPQPEQFDARAEAHLAAWQSQLARIGLTVPDGNFRNAFFAGLQHMLTATVGDQARIAALSYPLPWLRDSVYIIRCFDLAGFHDIARAATEYCVRNDFFGGFGAEGDAPGEGLWALVQHYRTTCDKTWLERVYPAIRRKCDWLFQMRRTDKPIQLVTDTPILPFMHAERTAGVICVPQPAPTPSQGAGQAGHGIILGTMDHHVAISWVNQWALCGLNEATYAACELGYDADAALYAAEARELRAALEAFIEQHPEYFDWERTVNSVLWPSRVWEDSPERIAGKFSAWWEKHRGSDDEYRPEPYWLYFELAQAHNALLLGQRERACRVLQYRLQNQDLPGLYGWREGADGVGTENAVHGVTLINQLRGCQVFDSIMPHGWSQAEMWLLQRAVLVEEWQGGLLLFAGVPTGWLAPNARVAFRNFPTWYGRASAELVVDSKGETASISLSGVRAGTPIQVWLPGREPQTQSKIPCFSGRHQVAAAAEGDTLCLRVPL